MVLVNIALRAQKSFFVLRLVRFFVACSVLPAVLVAVLQKIVYHLTSLIHLNETGCEPCSLPCSSCNQLSKPSQIQVHPSVQKVSCQLVQVFRRSSLLFGVFGSQPVTRNSNPQEVDSPSPPDYVSLRGE